MSKERDVPLPGVILQKELDARDWTQRDLAYVLGADETTINKTIKGRYRISPDVARALAGALGKDPRFFADLQSAYDVAHARAPSSEVEGRARLQSVFPIRDMIRRGWLRDTEVRDLEVQLACFFGVKNWRDLFSLKRARKKTNLGENATPTQLAWFQRVLHLAEAMQVRRYSRNALQENLNRLRDLMKEREDVRFIPSLLEQCGVRLVVVEGIRNTYIDGACCWLNRTSPVIAMSVRSDRIDQFWFVLRHEIEHVLRGEAQAQAIIDVDLEDPVPASSPEERAANMAAAEFCIPRSKLKSLITYPLEERGVLALAGELGIHPGIVVGQIQRATGQRDFLTQYQVRVRRFLSWTAVSDGWAEGEAVTQEQRRRARRKARKAHLTTDHD